MQKLRSREVKFLVQSPAAVKRKDQISIRILFRICYLITTICPPPRAYIHKISKEKHEQRALYLRNEGEKEKNI